MGGNDTATPDVNDGTTTDTTPSVDDGTTTDATSGETEPNTEEEDPIKAIQKLTGKLSQKMRDTEEKLQSKDIKYILNSIISASDVKKLSDEDKTDITNKIEDKEEEEVNEIGNPVSAFYTASGGQTVGEETKIRLQAIMEQARINVKNKLNNL